VPPRLSIAEERLRAAILAALGAHVGTELSTAALVRATGHPPWRVVEALDTLAEEQLIELTPFGPHRLWRLTQPNV
jgi:DNA-binding GntR family transcriptional regulator